MLTSFNRLQHWVQWRISNGLFFESLDQKKVSEILKVLLAFSEAGDELISSQQLSEPPSFDPVLVKYIPAIHSLIMYMQCMSISNKGNPLYLPLLQIF